MVSRVARWPVFDLRICSDGKPYCFAAHLHSKRRGRIGTALYLSRPRRAQCTAHCACIMIDSSNKTCHLQPITGPENLYSLKWKFPASVLRLVDIFGEHFLRILLREGYVYCTAIFVIWPRIGHSSRLICVFDLANDRCGAQLVCW